MSSNGVGTAQGAAPGPQRHRLSRAWLPLGGLLLALSALFLFGGDRSYFYRSFHHDHNSAMNLAQAANLRWPGLRFDEVQRRRNGGLKYMVHNRFPIGGFLLIKLAILPFEGDFAAQILAARALMLTLFCAAAVLAYLSLHRLTGHRAVALGATLLAFSSYSMLYYSDMIWVETTVEVFAMLLAFRGMVVYEQNRRLAPLLATVCVALLLGWRVYAMLAPFLALGLACELRRQWPSAGARGLVATTLRSRYTLVGAVALALGVGILAHNLATEQAVFQARSVADLPSFNSFMRRVGIVDRDQIMGPALLWPNFLTEQLHRLGSMVLPYALPGPYDEFGDLLWASAQRGSLAWLGGVALVLTAGGLALARQRRMLAVLALSGPCWVLPMRFQTAEPVHDYEAVILIGLPLVLFVLAFLAAVRFGRRQGGRVAASLAAVAAAVFALSCWQMGEARRDPVAAKAERALMGEFEAIAALTRGKDVLVAASANAIYRFMQPAPPRLRDAHSWRVTDISGRKMFSFFMSGTNLRYPRSLSDAGAATVPPDFVLAFERVAVPALRTPNHRFAFLYDSVDAMAAIAEARRQDFRTIAASEPVADARWKVYAGRWDGHPELAYLRAPCADDDTAGRFFLHVLPTDPRQVPPRTTLPGGHLKEHVSFSEHGVRFDDKCLMRVRLPAWSAASAYTGRYARAGPLVWQAVFHLDAPGLRADYERVRGETPVAHGRFDVHVAGRRLVYVRAPCGPAEVETAARVFLHFVPRDRDDLPKARRRYGFDNADFELIERGDVVDGRCVASAALPDYPVSLVRTGQTGADDWRVEFAPP